MTSEQDEFSLFSSLRYDRVLLDSPENTAASGSLTPCPFYLLAYHRDRMVRAARYFKWPEAVTASLNDLDVFRQTCEDAVEGQTCPERLRTILSPDGKLTVERFPLDPLPLTTLFPATLPSPSELESPSWSIRIDTESTSTSPFTSHKTTFRNHYMAARLRVGIHSYTGTVEVILWNEDGEVMEGSISSIYLWRDGGWVTPSLESGGNNGTTRRWLLEKGLVKEGVVRKESVEVGEVMIVSNGARGVWAGRVVG